MNKQQSRWIPMYRVEKRLTNANYIVRKINTNYTQCVHRMRLRPIKPQYEIQDLESIDPRNFEADPSIPEEEREPQFFDNQIENHINQEAMTLPRTVPETRSISFNQNVQTASFSAQEPPTNHQQIQQETIYDENTFFVEGSVPSEARETPETIDVGDYVFSANSNFPQTDARFGSQRPYNLRRSDHLALAREHSVYNSLQVSEEDPQVKVITYFPLSHYPDPDLSIAFSDAENSDIETSTSDPESSLEFYFSIASANIDDTFNSAETNTSMPQNNDATEQTPGMEDSLRNSANELAVTNSQEYNEVASYDDPALETTETDSDINFQGPSHSSPLRHRVPPRELIDLGPILPNRRRVIPLTLHRQQIDGNLHQTLDYATDTEDSLL